MKKNILFFAFFSTFLVGCGPAIIYRENYIVTESSAPIVSGKFRAYMGITGTREEMDLGPLFYKDYITAPFFVVLQARSEGTDSRELVICSVVITFEDGSKIELVDTPIVAALKKQEWSKISEAYVKVPIGDALEFKEGFGPKVELDFKFKESGNIMRIEGKFKGKKSKDMGTTFDVIMGV